MKRTFSLFRIITLPTVLLALKVANAFDFEQDILPILEDRCFDCHGEDKQKSGLRVDRRAGMLKGGDSGLPALVPGDPAKSYLMEVIEGSDPDMVMPPKGKALTKEQVGLFREWIAKGAEWPGQMLERVEDRTDHWSFQKVVRPEVPGSGGNPIDAFLNRRLKEEGLRLNGRAPARDMVRRASIVLTGLPPTPEETDEFVEAYKCGSEKAYAGLVDRLLASPHFGERWAQHWLDVIRWAETNGSEANLYRKNAWIYRDYLVRVFNEDVPYDQFVREQIAGDSLGTGEATGFLVAGPHVPAATVGREPAAVRQARADRMDEIMQTVGASVMGVTIGCARCHNHKFDPITIQDYYAMTAAFQDVEFGSRFPEFSEDHPRRQRGQAIWKDIAKERGKLREFGGWEEDWGAFRELHFVPVKAKSVRIQFKMPNVSLDEIEAFGPEERQENLFDKGRDLKLSAYPDGDRNHYSRVNDGEYGTMAWRAKVDKDAEEQPWLQFDFAEAQTIDRLRLSANREYFYDTDYLDKKPYLPKYNFEFQILHEDGTWKTWAGTLHINTKLDQLHKGRKPILDALQGHISRLAQEGPRPSFVGRFVRPQLTRVLLRGSPENPHDPVDPAGLKILGGDLGITQKAPGRERRVEFAEWITRPENPLTARVMANRIWHHVFGTGIVPTTSDFGVAGAKPSHTDLLDWLASEFVEPTERDSTPWSMKRMIRLIVMSEAFQRSSSPIPENLNKDANSRLLWRFPPRRVEAEVIRDSILQASGKLDRTIGGQSFRIHNVKKTYSQWEVVDNHGPGTWRRMLYQERMRRVDDKIFTAFDFPDCGQIRAKRPVSTTPLQALNLLNSPFVTEQSKIIVERAADEAGKASEINFLFRQLLTRDATKDELEACRGVAPELVARTLMNANEFVFLP